MWNVWRCMRYGEKQYFAVCRYCTAEHYRTNYKAERACHCKKCKRNNLAVPSLQALPGYPAHRLFV